MEEKLRNIQQKVLHFLAGYNCDKKKKQYYHFFCLFSCLFVFPEATGGVMLHTNMGLPALLVQRAMVGDAGTTSAINVGYCLFIFVHNSCVIHMFIIIFIVF